MFDYLFLYLKTKIHLIKKLVLFFIFVITIFSLMFYFFFEDKNNLNNIEKNNLISSNKEFYKLIAEAKKNQLSKPIVSIFEKTNCILTGDLCTDNPLDFYKNYQTSFIGKINNFFNIPFLYPQSSFLGWTKITLENSGFIPKTYAAQGVGFSSLKSIIPLWKVFRDISYIILVLVIVIIGFLIMFRVKINAQTIISIENSLPKVVLTMILITFSFPIAGFLIDLTNIAIVIIISILSKNPYVYINVGHYIKAVFNGGLGFFANETMFKDSKILNVGDSLLTLFPWYFNLILRIIAVTILYYLFSKSPANKIAESTKTVAQGNIFDGIWKFLADIFLIIKGKFFYKLLFYLFFIMISDIVISLLILISGLFIFIKIVIMIIKAYIENLLLIIISPLIILFEAIPGKNVFSWWLKALLGNLIIYPVIVFVFLMSRIIINIFSNSPMYYSPLLTINTNDLGVVVSFGIVFLTPDIIKYIREALGIKPSPLNIGLGTLFVGASEGITGVAKTSTGLTSFVSTPIIGQSILGMLPEKLQQTIFPGQQLSQSTIKAIGKEMKGAISTGTGIEEKK